MTPEQKAALKAHIQADQSLTSFLPNTRFIYEALSAPHATERQYRKLLVTELDVLNAFANPLHAEVFMQKLEAIAAGQGLMNNLVARTVRLIKTSTGVNIADPRTQAQLQALMNTETFGEHAVTQAEVDALLNLAFDRMKTVGEVALGFTPTLNNIDRALLD